jgi:hypothetical protein
LVRHKGARSNTTIDRDSPHQVEVEIPDGGLGWRYDVMSEFCRTHGYPYATRGIGKLRIERGTACGGALLTLRTRTRSTRNLAASG